MQRRPCGVPSRSGGCRALGAEQRPPSAQPAARALRQGRKHDPVSYDGPRQPNGDFLENLKITENLLISRFFGPCGNYGKITETLPKATEIKQKLKKKYKIRRFPVFFRNFRLMFADFENSEFGKFLLIFR